jgi:hypothetical protein
MATRNYPNDYFVWFNDDQRLGVLCLDTTSTDSTAITNERYDTFQGDGNLSATITGVTRSGSVATYTTSAAHGLAVGDRISISGTTNFNDSDLASKAVQTVPSTTTFTMSLSAETASNETSITASLTSLFIDNGLRITYKSKYETVSAITEDLDTDIGLDTSLHPSLVAYLKHRLYEDQGEMDKVGYFKNVYDQSVMKQRSRKSGVRVLAVPKL